MNNRQQNSNGFSLPPILQEQLDLPISKLIQELRAGKIQKVAIKAEEDLYLSAIGGGGGFLTANATEIGPNETFMLIPQGLTRDKIAIRTANGNYLTCIGGGLVGARGATLGANEQFYFVPVYPDKASIVTVSGFFFLVLPENPHYLTSYGLTISPRTIFTIITQNE
jgi:hypothetical protein